MGTLKKEQQQQKSRGTILICNAILAFSLEFTFSDNFVRIFTFWLHKKLWQQDKSSAFIGTVRSKVSLLIL